MNLFEDAVAHLKRSNSDKRHPFRYFDLATYNSKDRVPEIRTIVKREFDQDMNILFYTDSRSEKIFEIQDHILCSALFYHPRQKLQVRVKCKAELPGSRTKLYRKHKSIVENLPSSDDYASKLYPGTPVKENEDIQYGSKLHFSLVLLRPYDFDILKLGRKAHQRYRYTHNSKKWTGQRLVP